MHKRTLLTALSLVALAAVVAATGTAATNGKKNASEEGQLTGAGAGLRTEDG